MPRPSHSERTIDNNMKVYPKFEFLPLMSDEISNLRKKLWRVRSLHSDLSTFN
jgi:hypothetical protein